MQTQEWYVVKSGTREEVPIGRHSNFDSARKAAKKKFGRLFDTIYVGPHERIESTVSKTGLTHAEVSKLASSQWDGVYLVDSYDVPRGGEPAPGSDIDRQAPGRKIVQQWRVKLHSSTGPTHWIAVLDDGSVHSK